MKELPKVVLIAEDDPALRDITERTFRLAGYTVMLFPDGQTAMEQLSNSPFNVDVLLTDYQMPYMNGEQLIRAIRLGGINIPLIIMISGSVELHQRSEQLCAELGICLLEKPVPQHELLTLVEKFFE